MTQSTGKRTVSPYVGKLSNHATRCLGPGSARLSAGSGIEPGAVGAGVRRAAKLHFLIETGQNQPTITTIFKLAQALNLKPSKLVAEAEKLFTR
jgi:DNA-binding XRE family transcriptional regulator